MTDIVPAYKIEQIVGKPRHSRIHYGRAVSDEQTFYILHSQNCVDDNPDLRECDFSVALDNNGINLDLWEHHQDGPVVLSIVDGRLFPGPVAGD